MGQAASREPGLGANEGSSPAEPETPRRPVRPRELQDSLNFYLYHPLAWRLAQVLARTPLTPNSVSVIGGCFVVVAGIVYALGFANGWGWPGALLGLLLHMTWHVVDGADGDLAIFERRRANRGRTCEKHSVSARA